MFAPAITLAISKATTPEERAELAVVLDRARAVDTIESSFDTSTGIGTQGHESFGLAEPSAAQREALAVERAEAEAEKLADLQDLESPLAIIQQLHSALASDIAFWVMASSNSPPAALPILKDLIEAKEQLKAAFEAYISSHARASYLPRDPSSI